MRNHGARLTPLRHVQALLGTCCCLLLVPAPILALDPGPGSNPTEAEADTGDAAIDEVVVVGEKTAPQLRREIEAVETRIYGLFNDLNDEDEYDIICRREARVGSQIPRTDCKARIYWDALAESAQETMTHRDEHSRFELQSPRVLANRKQHAAVLRQKMLELAKEDPELLQALIKRHQLNKEYSALKNEER